jgi:hypothetical protein
MACMLQWWISIFFPYFLLPDYLFPKKKGACCYATSLVLIDIDKLVEQIFIEIIDVIGLIFITTSLDGVGGLYS